MNGYWFTLAVLVIVLGFISWMVHVAARNAQPVKFSWGEWQMLSDRAKETLINHGYRPPSPPHANFDHKIPESSKPRVIRDTRLVSYGPITHPVDTDKDQ